MKAEKIIFCSVLTLILIEGHSQITFEKMIPGVHANMGYDVVQTSDSGYAICGMDYYYYYQWPQCRMVMTKTDQYGIVNWMQIQSGCSDISTFSIQQTTDNGFVAAYFRESVPMYEVGIIRTNSNGDSIFDRYYTYQGYDTFCADVKQCYDQGFILCGSTHINQNSSFSLLIKTDLNGDTIWEKTYGEMESGKAIETIPDSGFIMLSSVSGPFSHFYRLDKTGEITWDQKFHCIEGKDFTVTNDGGYAICGKIPEWGTNQIRLLKTNDEGDSVWLRIFPYNAEANSISETIDGGFLLCGTIFDSPSYGLRQLFLLRTDQFGELMWTRKFGGSPIDEGRSVKRTFDTGFIITGTTIKPGTDSVMVYLIKIMDDTLTTKICDKRLFHKKVLIYPNPSFGEIAIKFFNHQRDIKIELRDLNGDLVYTGFHSNGNDVIKLKLNLLNTGVYFIKIKTVEDAITDKILIISQ